MTIQALGEQYVQMRLLTMQHGPSDQYSSRQSRFERASSEIIHEASLNLLSVDFQHLISDFARKRQAIAKEEKTPSWEHFGEPVENVTHGGDLITSLEGVYRKANLVALRQLSKVLQELRTSRISPPEIKREETVFGRRFSYKVELVSPEMVEKWRKGIDASTIRKQAQEIRGDFPGLTDIQMLQKLKERHPEEYRTGKMQGLLQSMESCDRSIKSEFVLVTNRTQIGDKMVATGQWVTWLSRPFIEFPFERWETPDERPIVYLIHQDLFLKPMTLDECAKLFEKIKKMDCSVSIEDLKNKVAELRYLFAYAMPYARGSGAIGEWLEGAIYNHFGYKCTYQSDEDYPNETPDLVALTALKFSDYLKRYQELVKLTRLS